MENCHFWNAFWAAQTNFVTPEKTGVNGFANGHKYHKLEDLLEPIHNVLADQGIRFIFEDINTEHEAGVRVHMHHMPSGQSYSQTCMVDKKERHAQATGGCYTYAKRYLLCSLFLISDPKLDDDADFATHGDRKQKPVKVSTGTYIVDDERIQNLKSQLAELGIPEKAALDAVKAKTWVINQKQADVIQSKIDFRRNPK